MACCATGADTGSARIGSRGGWRAGIFNMPERNAGAWSCVWATGWATGCVWTVQAERAGAPARLGRCVQDLEGRRRRLGERCGRLRRVLRAKTEASVVVFHLAVSMARRASVWPGRSAALLFGRCEAAATYAASRSGFGSALRQ